MKGSPFSLEGKTILITGASSGIGRAISVVASQFGAAKCVLTGRDLSALSETASRLDANCEVQVVQADVLDESNLEALTSQLPRLDGIVFNAGVNKASTLQFVKNEDIETIFETNCLSTIRLMRLLLKKKLIAKDASIVFIGSISGTDNVSIGNALYGASKSALATYMRYAALELSPKGIRCNAIHPGRIETPLIQNSLMTPEDVIADQQKYPLKRYGLPEEIAYAAIYFLSPASAWVTGSELTIDGGRSLK